MGEAYVRLLCPECDKNWQSSPGDLPETGRSFDCPDCRTSRRLSEFARTEHDLQMMKGL